MTHEYVPDDRRLLDEPVLRAHLDVIGFTGKPPRYSRVTTSTQDEIRRLHESGERPPYVAIADEQTAGRGRLRRTWTAPSASSVLMSIALPVQPSTVAVPLAAGVTVLEAVRRFEPRVELKWPNDLVVTVQGETRKLGGMIAERHDDIVILGLGLNIDLLSTELPTSQAISFRQLGVAVEREALVAALIAAFEDWNAPQLAEYRELCATIGVAVRVEMADGNVIFGIATDVDDSGALVIEREDGGMRIAAGDVHHVRMT